MRTILCSIENPNVGSNAEQPREKWRLIMTQLKKGDPAPNFRVPDQNNQLVALSDFDGRKRFIFFYPKANTSG
jgi:peroxiredoxin